MKRKPAAGPAKLTSITAPVAAQRAAAEMPTVAFTDITKEAGIAFVHNNGAYGDKLLPETMGSGIAWIATNGHTIRGTWRKRSLTAPTLFYDAAGHPVTLTAGQTFVQVMKTTDFVSIKDGRVPPTPPTTQHGSIPE